MRNHTAFEPVIARIKLGLEEMMTRSDIGPSRNIADMDRFACLDVVALLGTDGLLQELGAHSNSRREASASPIVS
jgi:hypothetical protein